MKVDVIQLRGRWPSRQSDYAIAGMVERARDRGHDVSHPPDVFGSAMITVSRNQSLRAVRPDSDFVLFVDDDMVPTQGALTRLMGHNKPVVGALCTTRSIPPRIATKHYEKSTGRFLPVDKFNENVLVQGPWGLGFGFILIKTLVLYSVIEYVLSARDWLELNREQFNRLRVRSEAREEERQRISTARRAMWEREGIAPVFQFGRTDLEQEVAEDMHFSRLLHAMGIEVWLDTGCLVGHIGEFPYSPLHLGIGHPTEVEL